MQMKIYHDNCINVMKNHIDNESVDLIVTDPPYLINFKANYRKYDDKFSSPIKNDNNPELISEYIKECYRILKNDSAMYMFCSFDKVDFFKQELEKYFNVKNMIIWVKQNGTMGDLEAQFGKQYEIIFLVNKGRKKINGKRLTDVWEFGRVSSETQQHQNQKPIALIEQCIEKHSNKGDVVFDGFMGSGTTGVACKNLGRDFIGVEIDENYYKMAESRINEKMVQLNIFDIGV